MRSERGRSAWLVTWEWVGEHAAVDQPVAAILPVQLSPETVKVLIERLSRAAPTHPRRCWQRCPLGATTRTEQATAGSPSMSAASRSLCPTPGSSFAVTTRTSMPARCRVFVPAVAPMPTVLGGLSGRTVPAPKGWSCRTCRRWPHLNRQRSDRDLAGAVQSRVDLDTRVRWPRVL